MSPLRLRALPAARRRGTLAAAGAVISGCALPSIPPLTAAKEQLAERQVLRIALATDPETIDPARASFVDEIAVVARVHANLMRLDEQGRLVPDLAERLPVASPDGRTLTASLRSGLAYSDGTPLTARDVVFSWRRHVDPRNAGEYSFLGQAIEEVRALDERTVVFSLKAPAPWFLSVLATWCGVPLQDAAVSRPGSTEPGSFLGAGPYVLAARERGKRIVFEANPRYHRGPPTIKSVEASILADPAIALAAYRNSELDIVTVPREDLLAVSADPSLKRQHQRFPRGCTTFLAFNASQSPLDRAALRRAIALALDRDAYVADALGGLGAPATQLVPPGSPGHFQALRGQKRDLSAARRMLAEAGFSDGEQVKGLQLAYAGSARARERAEALVAQLRGALRIDVSLVAMDARTFAQRTRIPSSAPAIWLSGWCQDYPDPQAWYSSLFHSRSGMLATGWVNPEVDRLLEGADLERDDRRRADQYQRAAQIVLDEAPVAVLYHEVTSRLVKPHVAGLGQSAVEAYEGQANVTGLRILKT